MKWTRTKPRKPGWYWLRTDYGDGIVEYTVWQVYHGTYLLSCPMRATGMRRWWYGPIQHPRWIKP